MGFLTDPEWVKVWVGAAIAFAISFGLFQWGRERRRVRYTLRSLRIIEENPSPGLEDMHIIFDGERIPRLTKSIIAFWNDGNKSIRGGDVVALDPMRLLLPTHGKVLRIRLLRVTRDVNGFVAIKRPGKENEVLFEFDYLDAKDGATIEILHTADRSNLQISGTIRGVPAGVERAPDRASLGPLSRKRPWFFPITFTGMGIVYIGTGLVSARSEVLEDSVYDEFFVVAGVVITLFGIALGWTRRRRFPRVLEADEETSQR